MEGADITAEGRNHWFWFTEDKVWADFSQEADVLAVLRQYNHTTRDLSKWWVARSVRVSTKTTSKEHFSWALYRYIVRKRLCTVKDNLRKAYVKVRDYAMKAVSNSYKAVRATEGDEGDANQDKSEQDLTANAWGPQADTSVVSIGNEPFARSSFREILRHAYKLGGEEGSRIQLTWCKIAFAIVKIEKFITGGASVVGACDNTEVEQTIPHIRRLTQQHSDKTGVDVDFCVKQWAIHHVLRGHFALQA